MIVLRVLFDVPRFVDNDGHQHVLARGDVVGGLPFMQAKTLVDRGAAVVLSNAR